MDVNGLYSGDEGGDAIQAILSVSSCLAKPFIA